MQTYVQPQHTTVMKACVIGLKKYLWQKSTKTCTESFKKMLYPTAIERQNVNMCVRLFDNKNVTALKEHFKNQIPTIDGTIEFLT